jgi:hypothetical protein
MDLTLLPTRDLVALGKSQALTGKIEDAVLSELGVRHSYRLCPEADKALIFEFDRSVVIPLRGWTGLPPGIIPVRGAKPQPVPTYYKNSESANSVEGPVGSPLPEAKNETSTEQSAKRPRKKTVKVFISYSHKDADLLTQLHEHLSSLRRQGLLDAWTDREIQAGGVIDQQVEAQLDKADLYLLLVSSAFIQSDYCFQKEFLHACKRQEAGKAIIVPIIVRECDWKIPELQRFKALPEDGKAVKSRHWHDSDEAFANVAKGLRALLELHYKERKENFTPDERHVTEAQRAELNELCKQVVDRLIARSAALPDEELKAIKGRHFGIVWSQFNKHFGLKHGLQSLERDHFEEAKSWMLQYRASKDKNLKQANPQKYRDTLTKTIYTLSGQLGWSKEELYTFAVEKLGLAEPITTLNALGNSQLELVRDRIRYEHTKQKIKSGKPKKRQP